MPYLEASRKQKLSDEVVLPTTAGDLTYLVYKMLINEEGQCHKGTLINATKRFLKNREPNFQRYCEIIGALDCAWLEYERRFVLTDEIWNAKMKVLTGFIEDFYTDTIAPYEDEKRKQNGDVV